MRDFSWVNDLKAGDDVAIQNIGFVLGAERYDLMQVVRLTPLQLVLLDGARQVQVRFRRTDGFEITSDRLGYRRRIIPCTPEIRLAVEDKLLRLWLKRAEFTVEQLRAMKAAVDNMGPAAA